jgi:hypothetical protein
VEAGEPGDQRRADPGAGCVVGDVAALTEGLEDLLAQLGRHARSLILDDRLALAAARLPAPAAQLGDDPDQAGRGPEL